MTGSFSPNELTVLHRIVELAAADLGIIDEKEKSPNRSASNRRRRAGPMGFRDPHVPRERRHFARLPPRDPEPLARAGNIDQSDDKKKPARWGLSPDPLFCTCGQLTLNLLGRLASPS
jgi:hypothetical protein